MNKLLPVNSIVDIHQEYRNTPISLLLEYHNPDRAEDHFMHFAPMFEIGNEADFIMSETKRLRLRYPKITIAPLFYLVKNNKLYFIEED